MPGPFRHRDSPGGLNAAIDGPVGEPRPEIVVESVAIASSPFNRGSAGQIRKLLNPLGKRHWGIGGDPMCPSRIREAAKAASFQGIGNSGVPVGLLKAVDSC
jgi:hypothetical protein